MPVTPEDIRRLWDKAVANGKALDSCPGPHEFEPVPGSGPGGKGFLPDSRCKKCGGTVPAGWKAAYELGRKHERDLTCRSTPTTAPPAGPTSRC